MDDGAVGAFFRLHLLLLRVRSAAGHHLVHVRAVLMYKGAEPAVIYLCRAQMGDATRTRTILLVR